MRRQIGESGYELTKVSRSEWSELRKENRQVPMRIYALAKELKVDSKELVEICAKAGITGKGSALASLDDGEVEKVRAFLSEPKKPSKSDDSKASSPGTPEEPTRFTRDDYIPAGTGGGKIKVIPPKPKRSKATSQAEELGEAADQELAASSDIAASGEAEIVADAEGQQAPEAPQSEPQAADIEQGEAAEVEAEAGSTKAASDGSESSGRGGSSPTAPTMERPSLPPIPIRNDPIAFRGVKKKPAQPAKKSPPKKRAPIINVAPMPAVRQPSEPAKETVKTQKPALRLPKDAISGKRGVIEEMQAEEARKTPLEVRDRGDGKRRKTKETPAREEEGRGLAGMASARADRQKARRSKPKMRGGRDDDGSPSRGRPRTLVRKGTNTAAPRKGKVALELPCTVRSFSEATGVGAGQVQRALMGMGVMATINAQVEDEMVELLAAELGVEVEIKQQQSLEDSVIEQLVNQDEDPDSLVERPPVVTFLGHVDHGKTSLLDYLIGINVVSGEAGGITQHIRAYQIPKDGRTIAFVDTPGHEAFTEMRARGANVTDIAVLVVAADDGIMPQTEEAISHAKAAEVPIIVALNKCDLPGVDQTRALTQLTEHGLMPSEWGGDIEVVRTSAITGEGMDELLETILTVADLHEYKANPDRPAIGTCLEAEQEGGRGTIAKLMVKSGTLNVGDVVVCGTSYGRVKAMYDTLKAKKRVPHAGPSMPVNVTGFDSAPEAGQPFYVLDDIAQAREIAEQRQDQTRQTSLSGSGPKVSFEDFQRRLEEGRLGQSSDELVRINLIIRADVRGSIEAIQKELSKLEHPEIQLKILQASVGGITVADVTLAHASEAVIIGFNVVPDEGARSKADELGVEIRRYDVIYKVTEEIKALLEGKLKPEEKNVELGQAIVKQVFSISRVGTVAGCYVVRGSIARGCRIRVIRDSRVIGDYEMDSLRHVKEDVKEVPRGMECGIRLKGFNDVKPADVLEAYRVEQVARTL